MFRAIAQGREVFPSPAGSGTVPARAAKDAATMPDAEEVVAKILAMKNIVWP